MSASVQAASGVTAPNAVADETEPSIGFAQVSCEMTAREAGERALQESEERFRRLVEAVTEYAIFMLDPDGHVTNWNNGAQRIMGYYAKEIMGECFSRFYTEEDRYNGEPKRALQVAAREGKFEEEGWCARNGGGHFWASQVIHPVREEKGKLIGFAIIMKDISTRKRREDRFRQMVESAPSAMVMINAAGRIEMVNAQVERVFGYSRAELLGEPIEILVPERARSHHPELRTLFFADPRPRPMGAGRDLYARRKDGSEFPVEIGLNPIETDEGTMVLSAILDLSARKRLEDRFRQVVESAPSAMVMINATGRIEMVNAQLERLFGYSRAELVGKPIEILVPERARSHHPELRTLFFADPRSRPMGAGRDLYARRKDGSEFPVSIGLNPIQTDEGIMVLSAILDISDRKRLEDQFRQVVESASNAMVMINATGRIEMVNAQVERLFGYSRTELVGEPIEILLPERFRSHHPELRTLSFADPRPRPMGAGRDLYGRRKDGGEFPVEIGLNPIETDKGTMVLSAILDISDRKQKEERLQLALKEKDLLLGEIHHRVKNNLQVVNSLLDLQSVRIEDATVLNVMQESQNRIRSMALIHQILYESKDFARVDFGSFLAILVPTLVSSYGVDPGRIALSIDAAEVRLPISAAIPCGLVVNELVSNALKHAFPDNRQGEVGVSLASTMDQEVILSVRDNGIGIPDSVDFTRTVTLGMQLVALLADQLAAELTIQRSNPTKFILRFSIQR